MPVENMSEQYTIHRFEKSFKYVSNKKSKSFNLLSIRIKMERTFFCGTARKKWELFRKTGVYTLCRESTAPPERGQSAQSIRETGPASGAIPIQDFNTDPF